MFDQIEANAIPVYDVGRVITDGPSPHPVPDANIFIFYFNNEGDRFPESDGPAPFLTATTDSNGLFAVYEDPMNVTLYDFKRIIVAPTSTTSSGSFTVPVELHLDMLGAFSAAGFSPSLTGAALGALEGASGISIPVITSLDFSSQGNVETIVVNSIPEPSTWCLLVTGLGGLAAWRVRATSSSVWPS